MAEKEHISGMLRMLQKLQDIAGGGGGQLAQKHAEKAEQYVREVSQRWSKKITTKENKLQQEARREAKLEADRDNYKATSPQSLREAKRNMRDAITMVQTRGRPVPDFLRNYITRPQTATVAHLIERVTVASDGLRNNPNFLLREAAKAYWGTNWMELTFKQAHEVHEVLDNVIYRARELAAQPTTDRDTRALYDQIFSISVMTLSAKLFKFV